jgi:hypothetical protein
MYVYRLGVSAGLGRPRGFYRFTWVDRKLPRRAESGADDHGLRPIRSTLSWPVVTPRDLVAVVNEIWMTLLYSLPEY